jgi:hypothetical protein
MGSGEFDSDQTEMRAHKSLPRFASQRVKIYVLLI